MRWLCSIGCCGGLREELLRPAAMRAALCETAMRGLKKTPAIARGNRMEHHGDGR